MIEGTKKINILYLLHTQKKHIPVSFVLAKAGVVGEGSVTEEEKKPF